MYSGILRKKSKLWWAEPTSLAAKIFLELRENNLPLFFLNLCRKHVISIARRADHKGRIDIIYLLGWAGVVSIQAQSSYSPHLGWGHSFDFFSKCPL